MAPLIPRLHLREINDEQWFPDFLRSRVQACLTLLWTLKIPVLQPCSPASLVAETLLQLLDDRSSRFTYVDFCSGAGGPTLAIEREFNAKLAVTSMTSPRSRRNSAQNSDASSSDGPESADLTPQTSPAGSSVNITQSRSSSRNRDKCVAFAPGSEKPEQAHFVLTDIAPHLPAWEAAAKQSTRIRYVDEPVDASDAPQGLLSLAAPEPLPKEASKLPMFRLFSLAFHHFDDPLAERILANTVATSGGFAILELQGRNISSQIMTFLLFPLLLIISPIFFWNDPVHLLFTYLLPIIPFVVAADGMVSSVRTRTGEEVRAMLHKVLREEGQDIDEWDVLWGSEWHTWPLGEMSWVVGLKKSTGRR